MTKKLLSILIATLIAVSALFALVACTQNNDKSEVKLLGITGSTKYNNQRITKISAPQSVYASAGMPKYAPLALNDEVPVETGETSGNDTVTGEETTDPPAGDTPIEVDPTVVPAYTLIYKSQTTFFLTINLENPNNHYIMDFRLTCPGSDVSIKQGSQFSDINDPNTYIRWDEATDRVGNRMATFELRLNSPEVSPDRITISEMYYSSRADGANKTAVNTDGKETYTIYKIDGPMEMYDRKNSLTEFTFKLNTNGVSIISVTLDETENLTADETGTYHVLHDGKLDITYEYAVGDDQLPARITSSENIELLKIVNTLRTDDPDISKVYDDNIHFEGPDIYLFASFQGTDTNIINYINDDGNIRELSEIIFIDMPCFIFSTSIAWEQEVNGHDLKISWLKSTTLTIAGTDFNLYSDIYMKLPYHSRYAE